MREKSEKVFTKRELKDECRLNEGFWSLTLSVLHFMDGNGGFFPGCSNNVFDILIPKCVTLHAPLVSLCVSLSISFWIHTWKPHSEPVYELFNFQKSLK